MKYNVDQYLNQIDSLKFSDISKDTLEVIQIEGLDEEFDAYDETQWQEALLELSLDDEKSLKLMESNTVEKFNYFDIQLKDKYNGKIIDLINYDEGIIKIIKVRTNV